jgi:HD-GYP domain-containing protein (c-di-GMP phosphodiesterase class II)
MAVYGNGEGRLNIAKSFGENIQAIYGSAGMVFYDGKDRVAYGDFPDYDINGTMLAGNDLKNPIRHGPFSIFPIAIHQESPEDYKCNGFISFKGEADGLLRDDLASVAKFISFMCEGSVNGELGFVSVMDFLGEKDPYTPGHQQRVTKYSEALARKLGIDAVEIKRVMKAASGHDIGKSCVPKKIIQKPEELTEAEMRVMMRHPFWGGAVIIPHVTGYNGDVRDDIFRHHELFNGKGYPDGLSGNQIPIGVYILSVVDKYDSLTTTRPYREKMTHSETLNEMESNDMASRFDPDVLKAFLEMGKGNGFRKIVKKVNGEAVLD